MLLSHVVDAGFLSGVAAVSKARLVLSVCEGLRGGGRGSLSVEELVREVGEVDDSLVDDEISSSIFVHCGPGIELPRRPLLHMISLSVRGTDHIAAALVWPYLIPVHFV